MPSDSHSVAHLFEASRLRLAREYNGLTRRELANRIGKTPSAITQFERAVARPDAGTVAALSLALGVPGQFFAQAMQVAPMQLEDCHFRSQRSASKRKRRQLLAHGTRVSELTNLLAKQVRLPDVDIPESAGARDIDETAVQVRQHWGLGSGPISNVIRLLEQQGVIICPVADGSDDVDAFSTWYQGRPFAFLASTKDSTSRTRFDAAHELGHLVLHVEANPGDRELERQAHSFAGAFLLPKEAFARECPTRFNWSHFCELKVRWKVSIAAMVRRGYEIGNLSKSSYRRAFTHLNRSKQRLSEPYEPALEEPTILRQSVGLVSDEKLDAIATEMGISIRDVEGLVGPVTAVD